MNAQFAVRTEQLDHWRHSVFAPAQKQDAERIKALRQDVKTGGLPGFLREVTGQNTRDRQAIRTLRAGVHRRSQDLTERTEALARDKRLAHTQEMVRLLDRHHPMAPPSAQPSGWEKPARPAPAPQRTGPEMTRR